MVPYDSRTGDVYDIKDWELRGWLDDLTGHSDNVTMILDCCHSGSGTRGVDYGQHKVRRCLPDRRPQPVMRPAVASRTQAIAAPDGSRPAQRYVLLAACTEWEDAMERFFPQAGAKGRTFGVFSYYLATELREMPAGYPRTYRRLLERIRSRIYRQTPQCEGDCDRVLFGGMLPCRERLFTVIETSDEGVWVDAGVVHGLSEGSQLHVYPQETIHLDQAGEPLAVLSVSEVSAVRCRCVVEEGAEEIPILSRVSIHQFN